MFIALKNLFKAQMCNKSKFLFHTKYLVKDTLNSSFKFYLKLELNILYCKPDRPSIFKFKSEFYILTVK